MTPRTEKPNPFERAAREKKAAKLVTEIERLAEASKLSPLEVFGRLDKKAWLMLAVCIGQKRPSVPSMESQILVLNALRGLVRREA